MYNKELIHYGVKGMRWGHRKAREPKQKRIKGLSKIPESEKKLYKEYDIIEHGNPDTLWRI